MDNELHLSLYFKILESSIDGIFAFDKDFRIIMWNRQMERFSGLKRELCLGKRAFEVFPLLKKLYGLSLQNVLKGRVRILRGMPFNPALNEGLKDYYESYYSPIRNENDEVTGILGIIRELGYRPALAMNNEDNIEEDEIHEHLLQGLTIEDAFSREYIQHIQDSFSKATGVGSVIIDQKGKFITKPSNFSKLCIDSDSVNKQCKKYLNSIWSKVAEGEKTSICKVCGLPEIYVPIMLGKKQLAIWCIGQIKNDEIQLSDAKKYAKKLNISIEQYQAALQELPYMSKALFANVGKLLDVVVTELFTLGLKNFQKDRHATGQNNITNQLININNRREELARIINKSPAIAFLWKVGHGRPVSFVSENINQFGYSQDEFQSGRIKFSDVVYKEDVYGLELGLQEYLIGSREGSFTREYRIITKHGGMRWVQERSWPRTDEKEKIIYIEGLLVDISVRKFAEEALIASEEQFKLLFERAPIGMALLSVEGEVLRINKAFPELIGYHPGELINTRFDKIVHPNDIALFIEGDNALIINKTSEYQVENRFIKRNGEVLYSITKIALIFDVNGIPHQKLVQIVDITNRKRAENDLIASQNKLQQAQSFAHLGNWEFDIKSNKLTVSEEVYKIYGSELNQGLKSLDDFLHPIIPQHKDQIKKSFYLFIIGHKQELNEEYRIVRSSDKKVLAVQTKAEMVMNAQRVPQMAIGTIQDITEMKVIEEELKTRNNELTNFVYKVSHDLRSPLLSITGLINLMKKSTIENEQKNYVSLIEDRVKRLDTFIMDILSHSKNLYTDIYIEKIDFQRIIDAAFNDLAYLENAPRIQKRINISKKDYYSDQQRLKDIFRNLISNSIQYLHPSKKNNIINIDVSISEKFATIVIEDNGLGIDKSISHKIFNMFYRGTEISTGSGIGLYIVNQAVEKLGGSISVESTVSEGSKFFIILPNLIDKKGASIKFL